MKLLYDYALSFAGVPYRWGGATPMGGMDCSGFVQELLRSQGLDPQGDQTADALYRWFSKAQNYSKTTTEVGSLVFFGSEQRIIHIALALSSSAMIEAGGGGSHTLSREDAIVQEAFVRVRPIASRLDFVAARLPLYPRF